MRGWCATAPRRARVTAASSLPAHHPLGALLAEQGIAGDDEALVLRRVVGADGRSRAFVNDQPVGVGLLRQIGDAWSRSMASSTTSAC